MCGRFHLELYQVSRCYFKGFQSYRKKYKEGKKYPPPIAWKFEAVKGVASPSLFACFSHDLRWILMQILICLFLYAVSTELR